MRAAVLHVISLAHFSVNHARGRADSGGRAAARLRVEIDRLRQEVTLLREEIRVKDARMAQIPPPRRPRYPPTERMAILELRAARGWSLVQTARTFLVDRLTIAGWMRRLDEQGPASLVQLPAPVNKFPDFVGYLVRRLRVLCPTMGKQKIAETLARAGLHLGTTTVGRMLKAPSQPKPKAVASTKPAQSRVVTSKRPNHVWHVDLTAVPIVSGLWATWLPFSLPQCWPFCWWVAVVIDHFSRRALGVATFATPPSSDAVRGFLGRAIRAAHATPKYVVCDRGTQFDCHGFRHWCRHRGIRPRFGAIGQHGSIAVVERFILTLKQRCTRVLTLVPLRRTAIQRELALFCGWYNESRPHTSLRGRTPGEVYCGRFPAARRPRYEPRARWPRGSPCAGHWALVKGKPGVRLELQVDFHGGRRHLPVVTLQRVA